MGRWGDILRARAERAGGMGPWGDWQPVRGTAALQVRVRRSAPAGPGGLFGWGYQFRSLLPQALGFEYRVGAEPDGPLDRVARRIEPGGVVSGTVLLPTSGPVWVDARLLTDGGAER